MKVTFNIESLNLFAAGEDIMANLTGFGAGTNHAVQVGPQTTPKVIDFSKVQVKITEQPASHKLRFRSEPN